ncbi:MAG: phytoene synthase [Methyloprofundus sp.]|nr:phytoene synthase [Methyloprofundus sp.]
MTDIQASIDNPESLLAASDDEFQAILLEGVSRTFALTIPQLPLGLYKEVANAYLLCRIVDTVEDEVSLSAEQKEHFCLRFIEVVKTGEGAASFATDLSPLLSEQTIPAEHVLVQLTERVIKITRSFAPEQIDALLYCVDAMAKGMPGYQSMDLSGGLATMKDMNEYCYYVAGCVGEMLAKLFCHYSPEINQHREELLTLSTSFGQGLQMTNILKDIWDDAKRGVCWLPQDVFTEVGFDLKDLNTSESTPEFRLGLEHLLSTAQGHLKDAMTYTLLIPKHEVGMRNFCLWAIGMAVLTLNEIQQHLDFNDSSQVKITRKKVKATILTTKIIGRSNWLLSAAFDAKSKKLICKDWQYTAKK